MGDPGELADAFTGMSVNYGMSGMATLARILLEAAADLARANHQPVALARSLLNLTVDWLLNDLDRAVEVGREAVSVARGTGTSVWISYAEVNLLLALWERGSWTEASEIMGNGQSVRHDTNLVISTAVVGALSAARGEGWSVP